MRLHNFFTACVRVMCVYFFRNCKECVIITHLYICTVNPDQIFHFVPDRSEPFQIVPDRSRLFQPSITVTVHHRDRDRDRFNRDHDHQSRLWTVTVMDDHGHDDGRSR